MGYFAFHTSEARRVEVCTMPGSSRMRVSVEGQPWGMFQPDERIWVDPRSLKSWTPVANHVLLAEVESELCSVALQRKEHIAKLNSSREVLQFDDLLALYDQLDHALPKGSREDSFIARVERCKQIAKKDHQFLKHLNTMRNFKSHSHDLGVRFELQQNASSVDRLREILQKVTGDVAVSTRMIRLKDMLRARHADLLLDKVRVMVERSYSHLPIIDESNKLLGVFSSEAAMRLLAHTGIAELDGQTRVKEFDQFCNLNSVDRADESIFISAKCSLSELRKIFADSTAAQRRLSIAFVTQSGRQSEPLLGLITVWDLS